MNKWLVLLILFVGLNNCLASRTEGGLIIQSNSPVSILNLATLANLQPEEFSNQNLSFLGTGYVGLRGSDPYFSEAFNLEVWNGASHTRTAMQIDISSLLSGKIIHSAHLTFLLGSSGGTGSVNASVKSFNANGTLDYSAWNPTGLGDPITQSVTGNASLVENTINITSLLTARINEGQGWLGLHLSATGSGNQLFATTMNEDADRANVRLTVNFSAVPEPSSLTMVGVIFTLTGLGRFRRRRP